VQVPQEAVPAEVQTKVAGELVQALGAALGVAPGDMPAPVFSRCQLWGAALPLNSPRVECIWDPQSHVGVAGDWLLGAGMQVGVKRMCAPAGAQCAASPGCWPGTWWGRAHGRARQPAARVRRRLLSSRPQSRVRMAHRRCAPQVKHLPSPTALPGGGGERHCSGGAHRAHARPAAGQRRARGPGLRAAGRLPVPGGERDWGDRGGAQGVATAAAWGGAGRAAGPTRQRRPAAAERAAAIAAGWQRCGGWRGQQAAGAAAAACESACHGTGRQQAAARAAAAPSAANVAHRPSAATVMWS